MSQTIKGSIISLLALVAFLGYASIASAATEVVTGDTSATENSPGWMFNRDTSTQSPFSFVLGNASEGIGSLFVEPITNSINGDSDKFIAEDFLLTPIADLHSFSFDFKLSAGRTVADADQVYMSVYTNFGTSSPTNFYNCRYDVVATTGSDSDFTTLTFDPTQSYPVTKRGSSPFDCPDVPADMDTTDPSASSTIRVIAINLGDTGGGDFDVGAYLDKVTVSTASGDTTYDFEPDTSTLISNDEGEYYDKLQDAIDGTDAGGSITVPSGTYVESGQILIDHNLTITGDNANKPVISPDGDIKGDKANSAWILVTEGTAFHLSNVVLDGDTDHVYQGIRSHGDTTIDSVDFKNITGSASGSPYRGIAVENFGGVVEGGGGSDTHGGAGLGASSLTVTNSTFENIGRIGILTKGTLANSTISGNTYTGKGAGDWLDYAFEVGAGGTASITDNNVSGNRGVASDGSTSAGILVTTYYGSGTSATIENNTLTDNTSGITVGYDDSDTSSVTAHSNAIENSDVGIETTAPSVDAEKNWWGDASGPTHANNPSGTGVGVTDNVNFMPWYGDAGMTSLVYGFTPTNDGTTASTTLSSEINETTSTGSGDVQVKIFSGTVVTSDDPAWDGTIQMPTVVTGITPTAEPGFKDPQEVVSIEVGSDSELTFSNPVKLVFEGQAGKAVGWSRNGTFTIIDEVCNSATAPTVGDGADCKIQDDGNGNLIVWTKHFSTFTVYTQTAASSNNNNNNNGGGNPGGNGPVFTSINPGNTSSAPGIPVAQNATQNAANNQNQGNGNGNGGQVLGAATFNFTKDLTIGSIGTEVTELQKALIAAGFDIPAITKGGVDYGYFGGQTKAAVIAFQKANGIKPTSGFVGPITRGVLNKGTTPNKSDEERTLLIQSLMEQLEALQAQLNALMASSTASTLTGTVQ